MAELDTGRLPPRFYGETQAWISGSRIVMHQKGENNGGNGKCPSMFSSHTRSIPVSYQGRRAGDDIYRIVSRFA